MACRCRRTALRQAVEIGGAGEAVDQRGTVDRSPRRRRAQDEIFEPGLGRAQIVAGERSPARKAPGSAIRARDRARSGRWPRIIIIMPAVESRISTGSLFDSRILSRRMSVEGEQDREGKQGQCPRSSWSARSCVHEGAVEKLLGQSTSPTIRRAPPPSRAFRRCRWVDHFTPVITPPKARAPSRPAG